MSALDPTTYSIPAGVGTVAVDQRARLLERPEALFRIGTAPDGLPLLLHVRRQIDVRAPVLRSLQGLAVVPPAIESAIATLSAEVERHTIGVGVHDVAGRPHYETRATVRDLLGPTLLARILGATSPMVMPEDRRSPEAQRAFENSALLCVQELAESTQDLSPAPTRPPAVTAGRTARLWLSLDGDAIQIAPTLAGDGEPRLDGARSLTLESLLSLRSARYTIADEYDRAPRAGPLAGRGYARELRGARRLGWSVSRVDVAWLLLELARAVDRDWHARGRVHADLKPGNALVRNDAIVAFDAVDVAVGESSVGLTAGWAPPEQLLARPLTPAADVFALTLMVASLLGAALYGEERTMILPARGEGRRRIRLITDPEAWIDPTVVELPAAARVAWRAFLMRGLASDPARRLPRGEAFAAALKELLERWELPGRVSVPCGPGRLETLHGRRDDPAWILQDSRG
ncbi:MAG: hypothetical protein KC636_22730 [Myxococcales bacterium]|nr:hypothetical protein [Myxococcales bacterium]